MMYKKVYAYMRSPVVVVAGAGWAGVRVSTGVLETAQTTVARQNYKAPCNTYRNTALYIENWHVPTSRPSIT